MAAVALQRELDAYNDAINKYNRQARNYKTDAAKYNTNVDAWNAALYVKNEAPVTYLASTRGGYWESGNPSTRPIAGPPAGYQLEAIPGLPGEYVARKIDVVNPGQFTMAQPTAPGAAPEGTAGQMKKLDQPSLADVERVGDKGLISSVFNF